MKKKKKLSQKLKKVVLCLSLPFGIEYGYVQSCWLSSLCEMVDFIDLLLSHILLFSAGALSISVDTLLHWNNRYEVVLINYFLEACGQFTFQRNSQIGDCCMNTSFAI